MGTYRIVGGERNGDVISEERLKDITVNIAKNAITTLDKEKKRRSLRRRISWTRARVRGGSR